MNRLIGVCSVMALTVSAAAAADAPVARALPFTVRAERPRVFVRATEWRGPNVPQMREWFTLPEYKKRGIDATNKDGTKRWADLHWLVYGDREAGKAAIARLVKRKIGGRSPSYSGKSAEFMAARYDWLRTHPDFTPKQRAVVVAELEKWGDYFSRYIRNGTAFLYSRFPGAISGLGCIGLALYGDSPKAEGYVKLAYESLLEYGRARAWEGGGTAGGTYSLYHAFPDLGRVVCAFESATDAGLVAYIRDKQDNWLERQIVWQAWYTFPSGYFLKQDDVWNNRDHQQFRMNLDILGNLLDNGYARTQADAIYKRYGTKDYYGGYVIDFFVFNDPGVKPTPLADLGRAELFGRDSHGYVFFRSGWTMDDTVIFFKCGEGLDVHNHKGTGGFQIWRRRSLAPRGGKYYHGSKGASTWHNNTMVFISADHGGSHLNTEMKTDVKLDFDAFLARKKRRGIEAAGILDYQVKDAFARVRGDLTGAVRKNVDSWTRELVFLGYRYLIVLDRVTTKPKPVKKQWLLHLAGEYTVDGTLAQTTVGGSTLFCRTLLPEKPVITGEKKGDVYRVTVAAPDDTARTATFLHVLYAADATAAMPRAAFKEADGKLTVTVGDLSYTFSE